MNVNKTIFSLIIWIFSSSAYSLSFSDLVTCTLENNLDICSAQAAYNSAKLSRKTLNGNYVPSLSVSSSTALTDKIEQNYMESQITLTQPIISGTTISTSGNFSCNLFGIGEEKYISQSPKISVTLSQSLFPYWLQGTIQDPTKLVLKQQENYYYNQLLYTKKTVLENLFRTFACLQIYDLEAQIYKNYIQFLEEQILALDELKKNGNTNQARITELESSRWNYQMDLMSVEANYNNSLKNIKTICNSDFTSIEKKSFFENSIREYLEEDFDPLERIYEIKNVILDIERIQQKQSTAPLLNVSVQPEWNLNAVRSSEWKEAWNRENKVSPVWVTSVSVDFSAFLNSIIKKDKKQYELNFENSEKLYNSYLKEKDFIREQYNSLYKRYCEQEYIIMNLVIQSTKELEDYEKEYSAGAISKLDFESSKIKIENFQLNLECIKVNKWLYKNLLELN